MVESTTTRDSDLITRLLKVTGSFRYRAVMAEQFHLKFDSETEARSAHRLLCSYELEDRRVFEAERSQVFHLTVKGNKVYAQCRCTSIVPEDGLITSELNDQPIEFFDLFYRMEGTKSGSHHPDGLLWIRYPDMQHLVHDDRVSLRAVTPTILDYFGIHAGELHTEPLVRIKKAA